MNRTLACSQLRGVCVGAFVLAAVVLCLMVDTRGAAGAFPGTSGLIVAERCDDGAGCAAQDLWTVDTRSGARVQLTAAPTATRTRRSRRMGAASCSIAVRSLIVAASRASL